MKLFRRILIIVLSLFIIFVLCAVVLIKTFDINRYRDSLMDELSARVGRDVSVEKLSLSFSPVKGLGLYIEGIKMMEDASFSSKVFLSIDRIKLDVDVLTYLKEKRIHVSSVWIKSPLIRVVRNQEGKMNVRQFSYIPQETTVEEVDFSQRVMERIKPVAPKGPAMSLPPLSIASLNVNGGSVVLEDRTQEIPVEMEISRVSFIVKDFSLQDSFVFKGACAFLSDRQNIQIQGKANIDLNKNQAHLNDVNVNVDFAAVSLKKIIEIFPDVAQLGLEDGLEGRSETVIRQMVVGSEGLLDFEAEGEVSGARVVFEKDPLPIGDIYFRYNVTENDLEISEWVVWIGSGTVLGQARVSDYLMRKKYFVDGTITDVPLERFVSRVDPEVKFMGQLDGEFYIQGQGFAPEDIDETLDGNGRLLISKGRLRDVNILRLVFDQISMLPGLAERMEASLPERYREQISRSDTLFGKIETSFVVQKDGIRINEMEVVADSFMLSGQGAIDFQQNIRMKTNIFVPEDLSRSMIESVEELAPLRDDDGRIRIPLKEYQGPAAQLQIFPDLEYVGKKTIIDRGRKEIRKLLFKALDLDKSEGEQSPVRDSSESAEDGQKEEAAPPVQIQQKTLEEQLIDNILDSIF